MSDEDMSDEKIKNKLDQININKHDKIEKLLKAKVVIIFF